MAKTSDFLKKRTKIKRNRKSKIKTRSILIVLVLLLILSIIYSIFQSQNVSYSTNINYTKTPKITLSNINNTDVKNTTGLDYVMLLDNNITVPSPLLMEHGFELISASAFNYSSIITQNATYPQTIVSIVYLTQNAILSNQILAGAISPSTNFLFENSTNSAKSRMNFSNQNQTFQYYNYSGHEIELYTSLNIPIFNASAVSYNAPTYQYTTAFALNNISGIVTIGGNSHVDSSISVNLSKVLFRKLVKSLAIS